MYYCRRLCTSSKFKITRNLQCPIRRKTISRNIPFNEKQLHTIFDWWLLLYLSKLLVFTIQILYRWRVIVSNNVNKVIMMIWKELKRSMHSIKWSFHWSWMHGYSVPFHIVLHSSTLIHIILFKLRIILYWSSSYSKSSRLICTFIASYLKPSSLIHTHSHLVWSHLPWFTLVHILLEVLFIQ